MQPSEAKPEKIKPLVIPEYITSALCDEDCAKTVKGQTPVVTKSGLKYVDIIEGKGASPKVGLQVR